MTTRQILGSFLLASGLSISAAPLRDNGIDPANLGKGDWISFFSCATNNFCDPGSPPNIARVKSVVDPKTVLAYEKSLGMDYVIVKAGTGSTNFMLGNERQFTTNLVKSAHELGLKIFGYTRSYGADVNGEIEIATYCFNCGADGFVIDAEAEWEKSRRWIGNNGPELATRLCQGIRARFPNKFLGHSPMPVISYHTSFPYKEFGLYCDAVMPQLYWRSFKKTPAETIEWMNHEWKRWYGTLRGADTNAIKPIVPVAPSGAAMPAEEVADFINYLKSDPNGVSPTGYRGLNFFRAGRYTPEVLQVMKALTFDEPVSVSKDFSYVRTKDVTSKTATIQWSGRTGCRAAVQFGTSTNYDLAVADPVPTFTHSVVLSNLSPSTVYHFGIVATNASDEVLRSPDFLLITSTEQLPNIVIDHKNATVVGTWTTKCPETGKNPASQWLFKGKGDGSSYAEFATNIMVTGSYRVFERHPEGTNNPSKVPYIISFGRHLETNYVNQQESGGKWNLLGTFQIDGGNRLSVKITDGHANPQKAVVADAIKISGQTAPAMERDSLEEL